MTKKIGGLGFLDSFHCEKIKFLLFASIVGFLILGYGLITNEFAPEITINSEPITYFVIFGILVLSGYIGVLYYKITNGKKINLKTVLIFWLDK